MIKQENKLPSQIWKFTNGENSGPNVLILGGTHGDEITGIEVIKTLLKGLKVNKHIIGNLFLGFGNPKAILLKTRGVDDRDLNRCFTKVDLLTGDLKEKTADVKRARELAPLLRKMDYFLDLHATSSPSKPFICLSKLKQGHKNLFGVFETDCILTDPNNIIAKDLKQLTGGTTDSIVNKANGLGFCYETGYEKDLSNKEQILKTVLKFLEETKVVDKEFKKLFGFSILTLPHTKQNVYELTHCVISKEAVFKYARGMNKGWQKVQQGQLVGEYESGKEEKISSTGFYIFPKAEQKIKRGKSLYYQAKQKGALGR